MMRTLFLCFFLFSTQLFSIKIISSSEEFYDVIDTPYGKIFFRPPKMDESDLIFPEINNEFNYKPYEHVSPNIIFEPTPVRSYEQPSYESPPSYAVQQQQQRAARRAQLQKAAHESFQFQMNDARARADNYFNNRTPFVDAQTFIQQNRSLKFHRPPYHNNRHLCESVYHSNICFK